MVCDLLFGTDESKIVAYGRDQALPNVISMLVSDPDSSDDTTDDQPRELGCLEHDGLDVFASQHGSSIRAGWATSDDKHTGMLRR